LVETLWREQNARWPTVAGYLEARSKQETTA